MEKKEEEGPSDDAPEDVKRATSVEQEVRRGERDDTFEGYPRTRENRRKRQHCDETKKSGKKPGTKKSGTNDNCCPGTKGKRSAKKSEFVKVKVFGEPCTLKKSDTVPRHCLSKQEYIDMLATPSRKCPPDCDRKAVILRAKPVSPRIKELAQPTRQRMLITLQDAANKLPPALLDNLIRTLENETCLTPEQAARVSRGKRSEKEKLRSRKSVRRDETSRRSTVSSQKRRKTGTTSASTIDKESLCWQYLMAERFVKSILKHKCPIPRSEFADISRVITNRLAHHLEYVPTHGDADRRSQQMRFLADVVACWISGVLVEVARDREKELEEICKKKEEEMRATEEETEEETDEGEDEDDDTGKSTRGDDEDDDEEDDGEEGGKKGTVGDDKEEGYPASVRTVPTDEEKAMDEKTTMEEQEEEVEYWTPPEEMDFQAEEPETMEQFPEAEQQEEDGIEPPAQEVAREMAEELTVEADATETVEEVEAGGEEKESATVPGEKTDETEVEVPPRETLEETKEGEGKADAQIAEEDATLEEEFEETKVGEEEEVREEEPREEIEIPKEVPEAERQDSPTTDVAEIEETSKIDEEPEIPTAIDTEALEDASLTPETEDDEGAGDLGRTMAEEQTSHATKKLEVEEEEIVPPDDKTFAEIEAEKVSTLPTPKMAPESDRRVELPFLTFGNIFDTMYKMIEAEPENVGEDPVVNDVHRAIYEKLCSIVAEEDPEILTERTKDVTDVLCGKIAVWLRKILTESQIALMEKYMRQIESAEVRDWTRWLGYVSELANEWNAWLRRVIDEVNEMRAVEVTRGEWQDWTRAVDTGALLWRRFYLEATHRAHRNVTAMSNRRVVKTTPASLALDQPEQVVRTTDLQA